MKVKVISLNEETMQERDYRNAVKIEFNGKEVFEVRDDEPEDSNLSRSFSDVWKIPDLIQKAYEAGKKGEKLEIEYEEKEEV